MKLLANLPGRILAKIKSYRSYGLHRLDRKIEHHIPKKKGFYIELGANDGLRQSNTAYFEKYKQWTGILIEPIPRLFEQCVQNRPKSRHFNCACTDFESANGQNLEMVDCNLMSVVSGSLNSNKETDWITRGENLQNIKSTRTSVSCRTLSSIIEECGSPHVDLLSLDVEGYEMTVLKGLDLSRHCPDFIVVEVLLTSYEEIRDYLFKTHYYVCHLSSGDVLFRAKGGPR